MVLHKRMLTSKKGRKCKSHGCKHILSIYNHEEYCHIHSDHKEKAPAVKASKSK